MKYYLTSHILKKSITGTYGQTRPAPKGADRGWFGDPFNFTQIKRGEFPNFKPKAYFELEEKGKYSDIVVIHNTDTKGFLVSSRVKNLWEKFNIFSCRYYPAQLVAENDEVRDYFLFHMAAHELEGINYDKTSFNNHDEILEDREDGTQIFGQKKLTNLIERLGHNIWMNKIYFNPEFPNYDLFYLPFFMTGDKFFISQKLVDAMNNEKITGLKYSDQNFIAEF